MESTPAISRSQNVLITGASSGIGRELAQIFARDGFRLILIARSQPALEQLARELKERYNSDSRIIIKDLEQPQAASEIFAELQEVGAAVDILVNNAGYGASGPFSESDLDKNLGLLQVNILALTALTRLFLPEMLKRSQGKILNIGSTAGFQPGPFMATYYASKAYVISFSEALAVELKGTGVTVTTLCPGPTVTEFATRANMRSSLIKSAFTTQNARTVAEIGYKGLMQGKGVVVPGTFNRVGAYAVKFLPRRIAATIVKQVQK